MFRSLSNKFKKRLRIALSATVMVAVTLGVWWFVSEYDGRRGKAEKIFVEDVVTLARGKWLVNNGVAREAIRRRAEALGAEGDIRLLEARRDSLYRIDLEERIKKEFPDDLPLAAAAKVGVAVFVDELSSRYPDRVYIVATGGADWDARWERMKPYLDVKGDPFLPEMRRQFALEGSALAFRELAAGRTNEAERVFAKIAAEIEPEGLHKSVEAIKAALPRLDLATFAEWNNGMVKAMDAGEPLEAAQFARRRLSVPAWWACPSANAVMGVITGVNGELELSDHFFRLATAGFDHVPPAVLNDHAETLIRLGRTDEARRLLEHALADDPAFAPAKKTLLKLQ